MARTIFPVKEGQTVFLMPGGNAARSWDGEITRKGVVTKIGRKYFYVRESDCRWDIRFDRETFESSDAADCNSWYILWETEEQMRDFLKAREELKELRAFLEKQSKLFWRYDCEGVELVHELYRVLTKEAPASGQNEPLTLDELKQMEGSPVWVEVIDHSVFADKADDFDGWGLVRKSWVRIWDAKRADLVKIDYDFEDYGKEWRAYRTPAQPKATGDKD